MNAAGCTGFFMGIAFPFFVIDVVKGKSGSSSVMAIRLSAQANARPTAA